MTLVRVEKKLGGLYPVSEDAYRILGKIGEGAVVLADVKDMTRRSNKQHDYWFKLRDIMFEAQEHFTDAEIYRSYILIRMGFCDIFNSPDGPVAIAHSLKFGKMPANEFNRLVDATLTLAESMGFDRAALDNELGAPATRQEVRTAWKL